MLRLAGLDVLDLDAALGRPTCQFAADLFRTVVATAIMAQLMLVTGLLVRSLITARRAG